MEFKHYVRTPFLVEAVEITEENMAEVAKLIGVDQEVKTKGGTKFILLDRRVVPNVPRATVGWFMTRLNDNYRCYSPTVFRSQFTDHQDVMRFEFPLDEEDAYSDTSPAEIVHEPAPVDEASVDATPQTISHGAAPTDGTKVVVGEYGRVQPEGKTQPTEG